MSVPKRKVSKSRRNKRRSHHQIAVPNLSLCSNCGVAVRQHCVCGECGFYKGLEFIKLQSS